MKKQKPMKLPLRLGTMVRLGHLNWLVRGVAVTGGERYYFLTNKVGAVALMPWFMCEEPLF